MTLTVALAAPGQLLDELATAIAAVKGADALAPVTVVVPTNTCGVMARRALGRRHGLVAVDMVTLNRLAELIAGPALADEGRSPMSSSVVDLAIGSVLERRPGSFEAVAGHPSTVVALRRLHDELRRVGPDALDRLAGRSARGREAARVSRAVTTALASDWYDEGDLLARAAAAVRDRTVAGLADVVVYLPGDLRGLAAGLVRALADDVAVRIVAPHVGDEEADAARGRLLSEFGLDASTPPAERAGTPARPVRIVSTTDADDEVRIATRAVIDAARAGTPFERIAVVWPTQRPYARLVEHHLDAAGIPWNGRPGTATRERMAPRLVLDLLDIDRRGLRRRTLFALVADVTPRDVDGRLLPTASWERVSREAGVARDDDWDVRLGALRDSERWGVAASSLLDFVSDLRTAIGPPGRTRRWWDWADWCVTQLDRWVGRHRLERLPEVEYRAWEALTRALDRLRHLDSVGPPVTRHQFRSALEAELDSMPGRAGRVGDGVTVGSLAGAIGLDVDVAVVLGAAEGSLPPRPAGDPLLSDADRVAAGLPRADDHIAEMHRVLLTLTETAAVTFTLSRGDLRSTSSTLPSRWLARWDSGGGTTTVDSHTAGLLATEFPASATEHRLRTRYAHVRAGRALDDTAITDDQVLRRALALVAGRRSPRLTVYDGDLSGVRVPTIDGVVSPTQLEAWSRCPHAYFMRYLLKVSPIDEPDDEISITAADRGSTHHAALDRFHRAVISGDLPQPTVGGWTDAHRTALMECFDHECERVQRRGRAGRRASWADEQERMRADLLGWLEHDSRLSIERGSTVVASEYRFGSHRPADAGDRADDPDVVEPVALGLPDGRHVLLRGSVDRIDRAASGMIVVTDHKSGRAEAYRGLGAADPTLGGTVFQLPAYAAAARSLLAAADADVLTEYGLMGKGRYERPGYVLTATVGRLVSAQLGHVVDGIESGYFPNRPERPGWHLFVSCEYCEPDHLGTVDRWREWTTKRHDPRLAPWFGPTVATGLPPGTPS